MNGYFDDLEVIRRTSIKQRNEGIVKFLESELKRYDSDDFIDRIGRFGHDAVATARYT